MAGMLLLAACNGESAQEQHAGGMLPEGAVPVTLSYQMVPAAQTRAAALINLNQDYIESGKSVAVLIRNHGVGDFTSYTYTTGSDGALNVPNPAPYYPTDGTTHIDIQAYYPASAGSSFTVQTDQSTNDGYAASDLMWATPLVNRALTTDCQTLTFSHLLSKLIVHATAGAGISKITSIALKQVKPRVSFNNTDGSVGDAQVDATTSNVVSIDMVKENATSEVSGAAVIPAQTITGNLLEITVEKEGGSSGTATYSVPSGKTFSAGHFYTLDITVSYPEVDATTNINDWTDGGNVVISGGSGGDFTFSDIATQTYTGSALTPAVTVSYKGAELTSSDYDKYYYCNQNAGTAYIVAVGKGATYTGKAGVKTFTINKATSSMSNGSGTVSFANFQGVNTTISRTISCNGCNVSGASVTSGSGFTVSHDGNTLTVTRITDDAFSGTITVTGSGDSNHNAPSNIAISVSAAQNTYKFGSVTSADVGKVLCSNGHVHNTVSAVTCGGVASGIICYVGNHGSVDTSSNTYKGLAIALANVSKVSFCSQTGYCLASNYQTDAIATALAMKNGINATYNLVNKTLSGTSGHTHYAANAANNYSRARPSGASGWFLPSLGQWNLILKSLTGSSTNLSTSSNSTFKASNVEKKITAAGGTGLNVSLTNWYYSSTEQSWEVAWSLHLDDGLAYGCKKNGAVYVRAVFAF